VPVALGKGSFALGKAFAECNTRQRASVESPSGKGCFAECQISGTRQRFDAVGRRPTPSIFFKKNSLPSATAPALDKEIYFFNLFAECHNTGTRQMVFFYLFFKIFFALHSAKPPLNFFFLFFCFSI